jgi:hypothetical protein
MGVYVGSLGRLVWALPQDLFGVCLRLVALLLAWAGVRAWRRRAAEQVRAQQVPARRLGGAGAVDRVRGLQKPVSV